jgi:hypothetical protein
MTVWGRQEVCPANLFEQAHCETARLLHGKNNAEYPAINHLASAAGRAAESLVYLASFDDARFGNIWPDDGYHNDIVDDAHVHWAATSALTSLDLCIAAASRLAGFARRASGEASVRDYYRVTNSGDVVDNRQQIDPPWRAWIDNLIADPQYESLLRVRNALVHADCFRIIHGTTGPLRGHGLRYGYQIGPLVPPAGPPTHFRMLAREVVELSRDLSLKHVGAFVDTLRTL